MFPLGVPKDLEEEADKWYSDYIELMEYRKNPIRGKEKCDGCMADLVEQAFSHVESMTESNDTVYETNFEIGRVREIRTNYYGSPFLWPIDYPLEEKLAEVKKLSIVPIRSAQDIYHGLTDRETLDKVLEQGLDEDDLKHKDYLLADLQTKLELRIYS